MEEKKTLKIKKPYLIIFGLAIAFAIMGFIDLKANAAESLVEDIPYEEQYLKVSYFTNDYVNKTYKLSTYDWSNPHTRIALYYGDFTDRILDPSNTNNVIESTGKGYRLCVLRNEESDWQYWYGKTTVTQYDRNMNVTSYNEYEQVYDTYLHHFEDVPTSEPNFKCIGEYTNSMNKVENLEIDTNIPIFTDWTCLREYLETGFYDPSGVVVDYSKLETDDNMPIPTNFVLSKISNNIVVGLKDYDEMYDYIKWSNTSDLPIQVQVCPIVQVYKNKNLGFSYGAFVRNYDSNYLVDEILEQPTISYIFEVRNDYFVSDIDPYPHTDFLDYYKDIYDKEDTGTFGKYVLNYTCGYRFRYVDIDNMKAGPWIHVWPDRIVGKTVTYITYSDGTFTNDIDSTGTQNKYDGAELDEMIKDTETENFYKDKYGDFDAKINVGEATNWLQSVASFIKGTPSFVGSVMSFLPEPIRYGMYVCLFLGVIASGYAIVKALI